MLGPYRMPARPPLRRERSFADLWLLVAVAGGPVFAVCDLARGRAIGALGSVGITIAAAALFAAVEDLARRARKR